VQSCLGAALVNAAINGALGWATVRGLPSFPVWRVPGVVADLVATVFGVTFGTCICMAIQVPRDVRRGKIAPLTLSPGLAALLDRFPRRTFGRGMKLGALSIPVFALPVVASIALLGPAALECGRYVALKASVAAFQGALITPFIVLGALADTERRRPDVAS
jgi:hypothetical protein